jgi:hypothetical protein
MAVQKELAFRLPLKAAAELQAHDIFRALSCTGADRGRALQPQGSALQRYIGLFVDWLGDFGTHAGWGNVQASAVDEAVGTLSVLPDQLDGRRLLGSRVPSEITFTTHFVRYGKDASPKKTFRLVRVRVQRAHQPQLIRQLLRTQQQEIETQDLVQRIVHGSAGLSRLGRLPVQ